MMSETRINYFNDEESKYIVMNTAVRKMWKSNEGGKIIQRAI